MEKPSPNSTIKGMSKLSENPNIFPSEIARVAVPQANQPNSAKPKIKSDNLLPQLPKQKRPIRTVFKPLRAEINPKVAA